MGTNDKNSLIFEHFGMDYFLGVIKKSLSEVNDTTEKDRDLQDDIPEANDSCSGEEEGGNSMTEEVK